MRKNLKSVKMFLRDFNGKKQMISFLEQEIYSQKNLIPILIDKYLNYDFKIDFDKYEHIYIVASGSSKNASEIAVYLFQSYFKKLVISDYSTEFLNKNHPLTDKDLVIFLSQSGKTKDTLKALNYAKDKGCRTLAITNDENSLMAQNAHIHFFLNVEEEKSIAATKSFSATILALYFMAIVQTDNDFKGLKDIDFDIVFDQIDKIDKIAMNLKKSSNIVFLSRAIDYPVCKEGALKLRETSYKSTLAFSSGEFMHGHFACLDKKDSVIALLNNVDYSHIKKNLEKIKQKRKSYIAVISCSNENYDTILIPQSKYSIFYNILILQLLSLKLALRVNKDIDTPRDLTKVVESE